MKIDTRGSARFLWQGLTPVALCAALHAAPAAAQLRVLSWNITNYAGGRQAAFQTAIYGVVPAGLAFAGQSIDPDVIVLQEVITAAAVNDFRNAMNAVCGCANDWQSAIFIDGPDTDSAFLYRGSRVQFLGQTKVSSGTPNTPGEPPRDTLRYDVRLRGYTSSGAVLSMYSVHMKAGTTSDDMDKRLTESQRIRNNAEVLNLVYPGGQFLVAGDFNMRSSSEAAYVELVGSQPNNAGRFFDPINRAGSWYQSPTFTVFHTQDPKGSGGMDDRHDQILLGPGLGDLGGFEYVGRFLSPQTTDPHLTSTFNDPDHVYRAWGNDGTTLDAPIRIVGNTMVGQAIAQAIWDTIPIPDPNPPTVPPSVTGGHLPVFIDVRVPARATVVPLTINFGSVTQGAAATQNLQVQNSGDTALWTAAGIASLTYSMSPTAGFGAPAGMFNASAGASANIHAISMNTTTVGPKNGTLTLTTNAPDSTTIIVSLTGEVVGACCIDYNGDTELDFSDIESFLANLAAQIPGTCAPGADLNNDTEFDFSDIETFIALYAVGC